MLPYIWSQFRHRKIRMLSVIFGIALGTALFLSLIALGNGYHEAARLPLAGVASDLVISKTAGEAEAARQVTRGVRMPFGTAALSNEEVMRLREVPDVQELTSALLLWEFDASGYRTIVGIEELDATAGPGRYLMHGIVQGRSFLPEERGAAVVDRHYAAFYQLAPGSELDINGEVFEVVGTVNQANTNQTTAANVYIPMADARELAGLDAEEVNQVYVRAANAGNLDHVTAAMSHRVPGLRIITEDSLVQVMGGIGQVSAHYSRVAAAAGLAAGILLAWFALQGMMQERRKEAAVMKAVGWQRKHILRVLLSETAILGMIGCIAGLALGLASTAALQWMPLPQITSPFGSGVGDISGLTAAHSGASSASGESPSGFPAYVDRWSAALGLAAVMASVVVAGYFAAYRVVRQKPAVLLRDR